MSVDAIDEVVLSLLRFEHRYIPFEGMKRDELFARVAADLGMDGLTSREMMAQAGKRVVDIVAESIELYDEGPGELEEPLSDHEHLEVCVGAAASVSWCEGFEAGMFHARRLADEAKAPNAER